MLHLKLTSRLVHRHSLRKRESLALEGAEGTIIAVDSGCLWLTMERDPRDIVLVTGMRFEIDRPGLSIVAAETDTRFRLLTAETARERIVAWLGQLGARLKTGFAGRPTRRTVPYF